MDTQGVENRENKLVSNSSPLRLNGGGNTSFGSQEEMNLADEGDSPLDVSISDSNCSNDVLTFINQDNSMSEQDIRDVLFEAGYSIDAINDIISCNKSANSTLIDESILSESESRTNS